MTGCELLSRLLLLFLQLQITLDVYGLYFSGFCLAIDYVFVAFSLIVKIERSLIFCSYTGVHAICGASQDILVLFIRQSRTIDLDISV